MEAIGFAVGFRLDDFEILQNQISKIFKKRMQSRGSIQVPSFIMSRFNYL
jgi:hypothetical protein